MWRRLASTIALGSLVLVGCPVPAADDGSTTQGSESASESAASTESESTGDGDGDPEANDGDYLLAIETSLGPESLLAIMSVALTPTDDPQIDLGDFSLQFIDPDSLPAGAPVVAQAVEVVDGAFVLALPVIELPGVANPVVGGDMVFDMTMTGAFVDADFACGTVLGTMTAPLEAPLDGSFGAVRIFDPMSLPQPVVSCAER